MKQQTLTIKGELTDLNTYIDAERASRYVGADIKKTETALVKYYARTQKLTAVAKVNMVECRWYTKDLRKDADNIAFALKFIMDGLVDAGVLPGDGRKFTGSILHHFFVDKVNPRVEVDLR